MLYIVKNINIDHEIDVWSRNIYFVKQYLVHESKIHPTSEYTVEEWDDSHAVIASFPYLLDPTKELIVKTNILGDSYLITRGDYVSAVNTSILYRQIHRFDGSSYIPAEEVSTVLTIIGIYLIYFKNCDFCKIVREMRKRKWELDPFTYETKKGYIRKRKI